MLRFHSRVAAALLIVSAASASAQERPADPATYGSDVSSAAVLSDHELAGVYGAGLSRPEILQRVARDDSESLYRLTAQTLPVTFDNWFVDVGSALIISNQLR